MIKFLKELGELRKKEEVNLEPIPDGWLRERRYQRAECDLNGRYFHRDRWYPAKVITIGAGGAFVAGRYHKIKTDDLVHLVFDLEGKSISTISRVVWPNPKKLKNRTGFPYPPGFAVEFEKISGDSRADIDQFVKKSLRILRALVHELARLEPDRERISRLFLDMRPGDSTHLNHIRKIVKQEFRLFRLRKTDALR